MNPFENPKPQTRDLLWVLRVFFHFWCSVPVRKPGLKRKHIVKRTLNSKQLIPDLLAEIEGDEDAKPRNESLRLQVSEILNGDGVRVPPMSDYR